MTHIEQLNRRLGERLGFIDGTPEPRFAWKRAQDLEYFWRPRVDLSWQRKNWSDRIGRVWALTMWRPPTGFIAGTPVPITREQWWNSFHGQLPYPEKGMRYPFCETALLPGREPDARMTQFYIHGLSEQMSKTECQLRTESMDEIEQNQLANEAAFVERAAEDFPAFWKDGQAHEPGTRGAHVSIGGL